MVGKVKEQARAFIEGFRQVLDPSYLSNFTASELRQLAEGSNTISSTIVSNLVEEMKANITIKGFEAKCLTIELFWEAF